jgi:hypothetical protein
MQMMIAVGSVGVGNCSRTQASLTSAGRDSQRSSVLGVQSHHANRRPKTHKRGEPQLPKWPSQRCSQTASWETKNICRKRVNHKGEVCVVQTRSPELSVFQQDQIGRSQMPSVITFDHVQSWCNPTGANNRNAQPSTRTMAKCRSQRHSQTVS